MILSMYAIKDELNGFTSPIPMPNMEMAARYLKDQAMSNPTVQNSPEDFSIWHIGEFDTELGRMIPCDVTLVERARKDYGKAEV